MSRRSGRTINLPAPYLKRVCLDPSQVRDREAYPFCLPIFPDDFELNFEAGHHDHRRREWHRGVDDLRGFVEATLAE
jgi:hypothetical protein